jgi:hypothetical protein
MPKSFLSVFAFFLFPFYLLLVTVLCRSANAAVLPLFVQRAMRTALAAMPSIRVESTIPCVLRSWTSVTA